MTPVDLLTLDGALTVTFAATDGSPIFHRPPGREPTSRDFSRRLVTRRSSWRRESGADLFPFYNTIFASVSNDAAVFM